MPQAPESILSRLHGRNRVRLMDPVTQEPGHFMLYEFANQDGIAVVHECLLRSLELTRADLGRAYGEEVLVIITDGTRTQKDLDRLAARLGWTHEGGLVAENSKHLVRYGGVAADLRAMTKRLRQRISQYQLGAICRRHFDWVKDDYADGHVHADNRDYRRAD